MTCIKHFVPWSVLLRVHLLTKNNYFVNGMRLVHLGNICIYIIYVSNIYIFDMNLNATFQDSSIFPR